MTFDENFPANARKSAEEFYKGDRLNCAESIMKALLTNCGEDCPIELLKVATGFGSGIGRAGCTCGALTGSVMAAGMLFGRTNDTGRGPNACIDLSKKIHDAFKEHHKATCCRVLHHGLPYATSQQIEACSQRTGETAEIVARLFMEAAQAAEAEKAAKAEGTETPAS